MPFDQRAIKSIVRDVPDYPKKGIVFKDITPLLKDPKAFESCMDALAGLVSKYDADYIAGIESRGFIIGAALAHRLGKGFIPIRKAGKLPYECIGIDYELEYGKARIEVHKDAAKAGDRVIIIDDVLATGGTAAAAVTLISLLGASVACSAFLLELTFLKGKEKVPNAVSLISY